MARDTLPVWDLSLFYNSPHDPNIEADMKLLLKRYASFQKRYKGRIETLKTHELEILLDEVEKLTDLVGKVGSYAQLLASEDTINPTYGILRQRVVEWGIEIEKLILFFPIEWRAIPKDKVEKILRGIKNPLYKHYLEHLHAWAPHTLKEDLEEVVLEKNVTGSESWKRLFTQLTSTLVYKFEGKELNQSQILNLVADEKRSVRKKAADAITETLKSRKMELTHITNTLLADKKYSDERRKYTSWIASRNLENKVSDKVVEGLVQSIEKKYSLVTRHYKLKRKLLKLDTLYDYDRYAPLNFTKDPDITWKEARKLTEEAYAPLGKEADKVIKEFFEKKFIHAKAVPNKRGGAFCASANASAHPYILVNYLNKQEDVFTLAHELGHGLHQHLAARNHGNIGLEMPLITQEMASTFGEMLLFNSLKSKIKDPKEKLTLIVKKVDGIIATVFRQTAMHLFEETIHTKRRQQGELTYEDLCNAWTKTQKKMFGKSVTLRKDYESWWSYIPHFIYTPGYVYAYAFGELLSLSLYNKYTKDPESFSPKYINLLKQGDSDYPENLLKDVGIDIKSSNAWEEGLDAIAELIKEEEALARELNFS